MCADDNYNTSYTLLERALNLDDEAAWERLYKSYMTFVYHILNQLGINASDIDDICQLVFVELSAKLKDYDLEKGKFRSWLGAVVRNTALNYLRKKSSYSKYLDKVQEQESVFATLDQDNVEEMIQDEWESYVTSLAIERIKQSHRGKAAEIFQLGLEGKSSEQIAEITGIKTTSVYTIRRRIKQTLIAETESIRSELEI